MPVREARDQRVAFVARESLQLTIVFEPGEDGWIIASIPEVPGAHSQGRKREEARANVIDALRGILESATTARRSQASTASRSLS